MGIIKRALLVLFLAIPVYADQVASQSFKGINNNENALIIDPAYAQDLANVDVTPGGKSIKKRQGYGLYKTVNGTKGMHGGYHFFDSTGNDVQVWGSSTAIFGIVADGSPVQLITSATVNSTWDCADTQGNAYCVDSSRDAYIKTNGATMQWFTTPLGTMVEATPDRIAVAGVSATPSTIYISGSNAFTSFTAAPLPTDPFTEVIASPGSKITHLRWGCQKLLWWKDQSFGYFDFDDQYTASVKIVSDNVGTFDNTSAIDPGGKVWFRGQDGHIYSYDCSGLQKESIEITPLAQSSGRRTANSWAQTSQSDFSGGVGVPSVSVSTTISVGDVVVSTFSRNEYTSTGQWSNGSVSNLSVGTSSITLNTNNSGNITNPSFESAFTGNWYETCPGGCAKQASVALNCTVNPQSGSAFAFCGDGNHNPASSLWKFEVIDLSSNVLSSTDIPSQTDCTWRQITATDNADIGKRVRFRFKETTTSCHTPAQAEYFATSDSYIWGGSISFYYSGGNTSSSSNIYLNIDNIQNGSSTINSGSFTSQIYDTGFTSATYGVQQFTYTANTSTPTFSIVTATAPFSVSLWSQVATSTTSGGVGNRYVRFVSTISVSNTDNAFSYISSFTIIAKSTGSYYSAVNNAPNISAWNIVSMNDDTSAGGSLAYYVRASTGSFTVGSSTPLWTSQTKNAQVNYATGTYMQVRADFSVTSATDNPKLSDFTFNWYEGNASDQAYGIYFDNAIWFSVAYGVGVSSNTYIFKRDLINDGWTIYSFGAGGMLVQNNHLFFGDVAATGQVFQYGSGTSDNGNAISAYWKTKDFPGQDPFLENSYTQLDTYWARNANQNMTVAYTLNGSTTSASYSVTLSSTTQGIIRNKKQFPTGVNGSTINLKFSDNSSSSAWELFLYRLGFTQSTYRPN